MSDQPPVNRAARQVLAVAAFIGIGFALLLMLVQLGPPGT